MRIGYEPDRDFEKLRAAKAAYRPMPGAPGLTLVEPELTRRYWRAPAFARELAEDLHRLAQAESQKAARTAHIERRLWQDPVLRAASVPTVSVAVAALASDIALPAREAFLRLLSGVMGCGHMGFDVPDRDLYEECEESIRQGAWVLYVEALARRSERTPHEAFELLTMVDEDRERLRHLRNVLDEDLHQWVRDEFDSGAMFD